MNKSLKSAFGISMALILIFIAVSCAGTGNSGNSLTVNDFNPDYNSSFGQTFKWDIDLRIADIADNKVKIGVVIPAESEPVYPQLQSDTTIWGDPCFMSVAELEKDGTAGTLSNYSVMVRYVDVAPYQTDMRELNPTLVVFDMAGNELLATESMSFTVSDEVREKTAERLAAQLLALNRNEGIMPADDSAPAPAPSVNENIVPAATLSNVKALRVNENGDEFRVKFGWDISGMKGKKYKIYLSFSRQDGTPVAVESYDEIHDGRQSLVWEYEGEFDNEVVENGQAGAYLWGLDLPYGNNTYNAHIAICKGDGTTLDVGSAALALNIQRPEASASQTADNQPRQSERPMTTQDIVKSVTSNPEKYFKFDFSDAIEQFEKTGSFPQTGQSQSGQAVQSQGIQPHRCSYCNGLGRVMEENCIALTNGNRPTSYVICHECGKRYDSSLYTHSHRLCWHCEGTGWIR